VALPALAAERRAAIDRYLVCAGPTTANPHHNRVCFAAVGPRQTDGQTDGRLTDA